MVESRLGRCPCGAWVFRGSSHACPPPLAPVFVPHRVVVRHLQIALGWLLLPCTSCECGSVPTTLLRDRATVPPCPGLQSDGCLVDAKVRADGELAKAGVAPPRSTSLQLRHALREILRSAPLMHDFVWDWVLEVTALHPVTGGFSPQGVSE